jgi:hypothetical protein
MTDIFFTELGKLLLGMMGSWVLIMGFTALCKAWWKYIKN